MAERNNQSDLNYRLKRSRSEEGVEEFSQDLLQVGKYTEGPLDSTFGQHAAFPTIHAHDSDGSDQESRSVFEYLSMVRDEAENDRSVYYVQDKLSISEGIHSGQESKDKSVNEDVSDDEVSGSGQSTKDLWKAKHSIWKQEVIQKFLHLKDQTKLNLQQIQASGNLDIQLPETASSWRKFILENCPPPIEFFYNNLDHPTIIKLIVYFTKWLSFSTNENLSRWVWSVFLRLDNLLEINESSIVRDLGKKALKLSNKITKDNVSNMSRYTIDIILVIVGEYYGQRDLLEL